jgi:hypothetical protein
MKEEIYYAYRWSYDRVNNKNRFHDRAIIDEIEFYNRAFGSQPFTSLRVGFYKFFKKYINERN